MIKIPTDYTLQYWPTTASAPDPTTIHTFGVDPTATQHRITGLQATTEYTFSLKAYTKVGAGPSQVVSIKSGVPPGRRRLHEVEYAEPPGAPTNVKVSQVGARSAFVEFTPGYDGHTLISAWLVEARLDDSSHWALVYNTSLIDCAIYAHFTDNRGRAVSPSTLCGRTRDTSCEWWQRT